MKEMMKNIDLFVSFNADFSELRGAIGLNQQCQTIAIIFGFVIGIYFSGAILFGVKSIHSRIRPDQKTT